MFVTFVLIAGIVIFLLEGYPLVKKKQMKAFILFTALLVVGVTLNVGIIINYPLPLPTDLIGKVLAPLYKPIVVWLKSGESY